MPTRTVQNQAPKFSPAGIFPASPVAARRRRLPGIAAPQKPKRLAAACPAGIPAIPATGGLNGVTIGLIIDNSDPPRRGGRPAGDTSELCAEIEPRRLR